MRTLIAVLITICFVSAHAEEKKKKHTKKQEISFEATDVDGQVRTPDGSYVQQKKGIKFLPVYKVEKRFDNSIKESVEYLR